MHSQEINKHGKQHHALSGDVIVSERELTSFQLFQAFFLHFRFSVCSYTYKNEPYDPGDEDDGAINCAVYSIIDSLVLPFSIFVASRRISLPLNDQKNINTLKHLHKTSLQVLISNNHEYFFFVVCFFISLLQVYMYMYLHNCSRCKFGILYNCCRLLCQCNHVTSFDGPVHKKHYTYSNSPKLTKYHLIQKINFNLLCIRSFFILWSVILQRITKWYYNVIYVNCCGMRNMRKKNHMHE